MSRIGKNKTLKVLGLITCLGAVAFICGVTGCAGTSTKQSTGEYIDDKSESARVKKALSVDPEYKYDGVKVETFKGTVQLSGFVNSKEQKNRAGDLAKKVEGVREVVNNITVKETAQN